MCVRLQSCAAAPVVFARHLNRLNLPASLCRFISMSPCEPAGVLLSWPQRQTTISACPCCHPLSLSHLKWYVPHCLVRLALGGMLLICLDRLVQRMLHLHKGVSAVDLASWWPLPGGCRCHPIGHVGNFHMCNVCFNHTDTGVVGSS